MEFSFTQVMVVAAGIGVGITKVVDVIRGFDKDDIVPHWCWPLVAIAIGVAAAHLAQFDVNVIPLRGPEWVVRSVVGVFAGGSASLTHEVADATSSAAKFLRGNSGGYEPRD